MSFLCKALMPKEGSYLPLDTATGQQSLPGFDAVVPPFKPDTVNTRGGKPQGYTLFLAIFPAPSDAQRLALTATSLRHQHGLGGTPLSAERMHITLQAIASYRETIPQAEVDAARAAAASVVCPPLHIVFDHVLTFPGSNAFVLRSNADSDAAIARLRQPLQRALQRAGLHPEQSSTPRMTMLRDPHRVAEHPIPPVAWTATRFALILSHVGFTHHQWIEQWALTDGA